MWSHSCVVESNINGVGCKKENGDGDKEGFKLIFTELCFSDSSTMLPTSGLVLDKKKQ